MSTEPSLPASSLPAPSLPAPSLPESDAELARIDAVGLADLIRS